MTKLGISIALFSPLLALGAQKLTEDDERWIDRDVRALVTEEEEHLYRELSSAEDRERFREIFWARRDPDTSTEENELRTAFEANVALADERFRARAGDGSGTEMGLVFLLLGFPASVDTGRAVIPLGDAGGVPEALEGSASEILPPTAQPGGAPAGSTEAPSRVQTWVYPPDEAAGRPDGIEVTFRAQPGYGYRLVHTGDVDDWLESRRHGLISHPELSYERDPDGHLLPLRFDLPTSVASALLEGWMGGEPLTHDVPFHVTPAFFRSHEASVYVPLLFELEEGEVSKDVTFFGAVRASGRIVHRFEERAQFSGDGGSFEVPLQLAPGNYEVTVGVLDESSGRSGGRAAALQVPSFDPETFSMSSVVLHSGASKSDEPGGIAGRAFQFGGIRLSARRFRPFVRSDSLGVFFYAYGFAREPGTDRGTVTARYRFLRDGTEVAQTEPRALFASEEQAIAGDEIPLESFAPGDYQLVILVTDVVSGKDVERRVSFRIAP